MAIHEDQVISLLEKVKRLIHDKEKVIVRICELWGLITPKMDTMLISLKEAQDALGSKDPSNLKSEKMQVFLFNGLI